MACLNMSQPSRFTLWGLNIYRDPEILPSLAFLLSYVLSGVEFHKCGVSHLFETPRCGSFEIVIS